MPGTSSGLLNQASPFLRLSARAGRAVLQSRSEKQGWHRVQCLGWHSSHSRFLVNVL